MRYVFLALLVLNILVFGYYSFLAKPSDSSNTVAKAQAELVNPVTATNVTSELPPMIGTKK